MKRFILPMLCFVLVFALATTASAARVEDVEEELSERFADDYEVLMGSDGKPVGLFPNSEEMAEFVQSLGYDLPYMIVQKSMATTWAYYVFSPMPFRVWNNGIASDPSSGAWVLTIHYSASDSGNRFEVYEESSYYQAFESGVGTPQNLYWTNHPLKDAEGTLIYNASSGPFPGPLPMYHQVNLVAGQKLLGEAVPTLRQNLIPILLCGVGCLALLILLHLFGKKSQIFHL